MAEAGLTPARTDLMMCDKHPNAKAVIYCEYHDVVCCLTCAWESHHACRPKPCKLEDAVMKFEDEQSDWVDQLNSCSDSSKSIIDTLKRQIKSMEESESVVLEEFSSIKDEVMSKLSELEQHLTYDIEDKISNKTKAMIETLARIEQQKQSLDQTMKDIQYLLQTKDPDIVAAFVKCKHLIKSCDVQLERTVRIPTFEVSKEIHNFLNCTSVGKISGDDKTYENVTSPSEVSLIHEKDNKEDEETIKSDFLQDAKPKPKQERSGITFGKIFRLFKFRSSRQASDRKPTTNPVPLPLADSGNIEDEEWFHGSIDRSIANICLIGNGDYLVRSKTNQDTGRSDYVLSVCSKIQHHAYFKSVKDGWKFKGKRFSTLEKLIQHLHQSMAPLITASHKVVLHTPVPRRPSDEAEATARETLKETLKRRPLCQEDERIYEHVFDVGQRIIKERSKDQGMANYDFDSQESKDQVMANYDFDSQESDELSFKKGEILEVVTKDGEDWWTARNKNGQVGNIPVSYITNVQDPRLITELDGAEAVGEDDQTSAYELWTPPPYYASGYEFTCDIGEIQWFHGCLPRENAEKRLTNDGDYLVREHNQGKDVKYIVSVFWKGHRHFKYQKIPNYTQPHNPVQHFTGIEVPITAESGVMLRNPILRESWEIRNGDIEIQNKYKRGDFGDIHNGFYKITHEVLRLNLVRDDLSDDDKKIFFGEALILCQFQHPNIVKCFGIAMDYDPIMVVLEHTEDGDLLTFLKDKRYKRSSFEMCLDIARAIDYIQERKCIHRNIMAMSCLLGDEGIVKLSGFSMCSKTDHLRSESHHFKVPIKWTAPEAFRSADLQNRFCLKSDIWSFGVLLWEVFSQGKLPYRTQTNKEVVKLVLDGYRMPPPPDTPSFIAEMMTRCWKKEPNRRPNINHIIQWLKSALNSPNIANFKLPPLPPLPTQSQNVVTSVEKTADPALPTLPPEWKKNRALPLPPTPAVIEADLDAAKEKTEERKLHRRQPSPLPEESEDEEYEDTYDWSMSLFNVFDRLSSNFVRSNAKSVGLHDENE